MNLLKLSLCAVVALSGATALGCNASDDSTPATQSDYDDVAQALGGAVATDNQGGMVGTISDATSVALGVPRLGLRLGANGNFAGLRGELNYEYSSQCFSDTGEGLTVCDGSARMAEVSVRWSGRLVTPHVNAAVEHEGQLSVTGLQNDPLRVDGGGSFDFDATFRSHVHDVERNYRLSYAATYEALLVTRLSGDVIGGSAYFEIHAERMVSTTGREREASFLMDATIVFHNDHTAALTLDGEYTYMINTRTGAVER